MTDTDLIHLETHGLGELQRMYATTIGKPTRCPNKKWLVERIREAQAAIGDSPVEPTAPLSEVVPADGERAGMPDAPEPEVPLADAPSTEPTRKRGRFAGMTIEELQALYLHTVGRTTSSSSRLYIEWRVREAEKGRIRVGPATATARVGAASEVMVLPLRMERELVEELDAAWKRLGMKSRMEFLRRAMRVFLVGVGETDVVAKLTQEA